MRILLFFLCWKKNFVIFWFSIGVGLKLLSGVWLRFSVVRKSWKWCVFGWLLNWIVVLLMLFCCRLLVSFCVSCGSIILF